MAKRNINLQEESDGSWQIDYKKRFKAQPSQYENTNKQREGFMQDIKVKPEKIEKKSIVENKQLDNIQKENDDMCK
jgi:hypothetical protein